MLIISISKLTNYLNARSECFDFENAQMLNIVYYWLFCTLQGCHILEFNFSIVWQPCLSYLWLRRKLLL